jgi:hypothetical protein
MDAYLEVSDEQASAAAALYRAIVGKVSTEVVGQPIVEI